MYNNNNSGVGGNSRNISLAILLILVILTIYNNGVGNNILVNAAAANSNNNNNNNNLLYKNIKYNTQLHERVIQQLKPLVNNNNNNNNKIISSSSSNKNNNNNHVQKNNNNNNHQQYNINNLNSDLCLPCVDFFNSYLPTIIKIITDYGVIESCSKICGYLNNTVEVDICTGLCDLVGVNEFWKIFLLDDINPIYACQLVTACVTEKNPAANFDSVSLTPAVAVPGSTFTISLNFTVLNATGVGQFTYIVYYVATQSKYVYSLTFDSLAPGNYSQNFTFTTKNNGSFPTGDYPIELMMCAAECGTHTPYSIVLNDTQLVFTLDTFPTTNDDQADDDDFKDGTVVSFQTDDDNDNGEEEESIRIVKGHKDNVVTLPLPAFSS